MCKKLRPLINAANPAVVIVVEKSAREICIFLIFTRPNLRRFGADRILARLEIVNNALDERAIFRLAHIGRVCNRNFDLQNDDRRYDERLEAERASRPDRRHETARSRREPFEREDRF